MTKQEKLKNLEYQLKWTNFWFDFAVNRDYECDWKRTKFLLLKKTDIEKEINKLEQDITN